MRKRKPSKRISFAFSWVVKGAQTRRTLQQRKALMIKESWS